MGLRDPLRRVQEALKAIETDSPILFHSMYLLINLRKSTTPQNRQPIEPNILISNSKQLVDDFVGELTF